MANLGFFRVNNTSYNANQLVSVTTIVSTDSEGSYHAMDMVFSNNDNLIVVAEDGEQERKAYNHVAARIDVDPVSETTK